MCDQGHRFEDVQNYTLGQFSVFLKHCITKNKNKAQEKIFGRVQLLDSMRMAQHSTAQAFGKYRDQLLKSTTAKKNKGENTSTQAARELLSKGVAHCGRKRK